MPGLSIHVVDIARGRVAEGMAVTLTHRDPLATAEPICGRVAASGLVDAPELGREFAAGRYEVLFAVGDYLRVLGQQAAFLDDVPFRFRIDDHRPHLHLPFKFTPWGFSCFRGA